MKIVKSIDEYCTKQGITVHEFERRCNLANSLVHKWRLGLQSPSLRTVHKICKATGTEIGAWI
jgi:transcriptional regulator with XRE-family HTH domain